MVTLAMSMRIWSAIRADFVPGLRRPSGILSRQNATRFVPLASASAMRTLVPVIAKADQGGGGARTDGARARGGRLSRGHRVVFSLPPTVGFVVGELGSGPHDLDIRFDVTTNMPPLSSMQRLFWMASPGNTRVPLSSRLRSIKNNAQVAATAM